jgi:type IV secretion system protein VirD4
MRDLDDLARLLGDRDEQTLTVSRGAGNDRSTSVSVRRIPVLPPDLLRTLPFGTAALLLRQARPAVIDLQPWTARRDAPQLRAAQARTEATSAAGATRS